MRINTEDQQHSNRGTAEELQSGFDAGAGVEEVAHGVAYEVEGEHGEHDGEGGKKDDVGRIEEVRAAIVEHGSPTWHGGRDAEPEEAHGAFGENGSGHANGGLHNDWLHDVGQDVAGKDAKVAGSESARSFDIFTLAGGEDLGADESGVADPASNDEGEDEIPEAGAEECDKGDGQQDSGKRKKRVHHDDVDEAVNESAVVSGERADDGSEEERPGDDGDSDDHGDARAVEDAREDVSAKFVGAEEVVRGGRLQARGEIDEGGISRGDERSESGAEDEERDEHEAEERKRIATQNAKGGHELPQSIAVDAENRAQERNRALVEKLGAAPRFPTYRGPSLRSG